MRTLHINLNGKNLFFSVKEVIASNPYTFEFIDKFNKEYIINKKYIIEYEDKNEKRNINKRNELS